MVLSIAVVVSCYLKTDLFAGGQVVTDRSRSLGGGSTGQYFGRLGSLYPYEWIELSRALDKLELSCDWLTAVLRTTTVIYNKKTHSRAVDFTTTIVRETNIRCRLLSLHSAKQQSTGYLQKHHVSSAHQVSDVLGLT